MSKKNYPPKPDGLLIPINNVFDFILEECHQSSRMKVLAPKIREIQTSGDWQKNQQLAWELIHDAMDLVYGRSDESIYVILEGESKPTKKGKK